MLQPGESEDLALEAFRPQGFPHGRRQDLERDPPLVPAVEREKHRRGRPVSEHVFDGVAVGELGGDPVGVGREHMSGG